ncbi:AMED_5909 family protein [Lentzea sp. NPDC034063]|uniref:AMED_5909 family protein n=1 Tax=unclassified Lentzea TaxID=2643253 RepID=UPI0033A9C57E
MPATEAMHWGLAEQARTLSEAHDVLSKLLPNPKAAPAVLRDYYLRSAAIYARVAESDRSHHHEAMYWANREREKGEAIKVTKTAKK